jgi:acyl-coenzyme A thioesterase PaaI-like protein
MSAPLLKKLQKYIGPQGLKKLMNIWFPFRGSGISIDKISNDYREIRVSLAFEWYNKNYVGTQFGGSLYAMVDPFYMLMLMHILGKDYIVWDRSAEIQFLRPGRSKVFAHFKISQESIDLIKEKTQNGDKYFWNADVDIFNIHGEVIATVKKTIYIKYKIDIKKT